MSFTASLLAEGIVLGDMVVVESDCGKEPTEELVSLPSVRTSVAFPTSREDTRLAEASLITVPDSLSRDKD